MKGVIDGIEHEGKEVHLRGYGVFNLNEIKESCQSIIDCVNEIKFYKGNSTGQQVHLGLLTSHIEQFRVLTIGFKSKEEFIKELDKKIEIEN